MSRALLAEWTKLRTVPSNVAAVSALVVLMMAGTVLIVASTDLPYCLGQPDGCPARDATALTLAGVHFAQLAAIVLGVVAISAEFHPPVIRTTFAMHPRRTTVFPAKAAVVSATVCAAAAIGVVGAVLVGRAVLDGKDLTADRGFDQAALSDGALHRAVLGTVLYLALIALLSVGVTAAVRHPGASIGTMVALLYGPYLVTVIVSMPVRTLHAIQDASPMTAGLAVQTTVAATGTAPLGPWAGLGVLAAYAVAALAAGGILFTIRDV